MQTSRLVLLLLALSILGVATHLIPHDMGISTVGAVGMLCAAYLPLRYLVVPVLVTVAVADVLNGTYGSLAMSFVYAGHMAAVFAAKPVLGKVSPSMVLVAAGLSAVAFYLVSNVTPMVMQYYPNTLAGWTACYVNGLPYLLRGFIANLVFGGLFFTLIYFVRRQYAHRLTAA